MAGVVRGLLAPDSAGGLGQGTMQLVRVVPGVPDPATPWIPAVPSELVADVDQIGEEKAEYVQGGTVVITDRALMITPPAGMTPKPGDVVRARGVAVGTIVHAAPFGSLDVPLYVTIYLNR